MPSIAKKMIVGFGTLTALMAGGIGAGVWATHGTSTGYSDLLNDENRTARLAQDATIGLLEQLRSQKDFLMHEDLSDADRVTDQCRRTDEAIAGILSLAQQRGHAMTVDAAKRLVDLAQSYQSAFTRLVAAYQERGLSERDGLRAVFHAAAGNLADRVQEKAAGELYLAFLECREAGAAFERVPNDSRLSAWTQALTKVSALFDLYGKTSTAAGETTKALGAQLSAYRALRESLAANPTGPQAKAQWAQLTTGPESLITLILGTIYIPDLENLYQELRRQESDYLLARTNSEARQVREATSGLSDAVSSSLVPDDSKQDLLAALDQYQKAFEKLVAVDTSIADCVSQFNNAAHAMEPDHAAAARRCGRGVRQGGSRHRRAARHLPRTHRRHHRRAGGGARHRRGAGDDLHDRASDPGAWSRPSTTSLRATSPYACLRAAGMSSPPWPARSTAWSRICSRW